MYIYPVQFPQVSNREDLLITCSLFDDDTGDPIDVSGVTLAVPGQSFTANAWTVTDGQIVTNSATAITIPTFPYGNQLSARAFMVGLNLGILPADPIIIADTATGNNQLAGYVISYAPTTGALIVQIGWTFEFEIRHWRRGRGGAGWGDGYSSSPGAMSTYDETGPVLSAQLGNGITITDIGYLQILIPASLFGKLREHTYLIAMNMTDSINTRQVFLGELPVQFGGVTRNPSPNAANAAWANQF